MKILIIANGKIGQPDFYQELIKNSNLIICADGGVNHCGALNVVPDFVIGDMDSIDKELLVQYQSNDKVKVIIDKDQNKTDLELALELAQTLGPVEIIILGAVGDRLDHTLGNLACLSKFDGKIKIEDDKQEIFLVSDYIEINGKIGETVSIIPVDEVRGLTYTGLKWNVENKNLEFGWLGVCNKLASEKATIKLKSGKILVFKLKN